MALPYRFMGCEKRFWYGIYNHITVLLPRVIYFLVWNNQCISQVCVKTGISQSNRFCNFIDNLIFHKNVTEYKQLKYIK